MVYFVPHETFLNDIVTAIQVGENSRAYIINKSGDTIADITLDTITVQNIEAEAESDPSLEQLAAIHAKMREGETGFGSYTSGEDQMYAAYAPMEDTDGWSIAVTAPQLNYLASTRDGMVVNIGGDRDRHVSIHYHSADIGNQDRQTDESLRKAYEAACGGRSGYAHAKDQEPG